MLDNRIAYEDSYVSSTYEMTTGYFTIDKSLLEEFCPNQYPEVEHGEISVEYPTQYPEANMATVMVSPTKEGTDYDWTGIDLPYEIIDDLIAVTELFTTEN